MTGPINTRAVIKAASAHLKGVAGHVFDLLTITKPVSPTAAVNLAKVISKLSPLLGNMIEFNTVELLNADDTFVKHGKWVRQDPGFPDTVFKGAVTPRPGFEIKAWLPLATEITARFKDSQNHFLEDNTYVAMLAWLPENLIYGRPCIIDVCVVSGLSVAKARDDHYHNPPDYLVLEPGDTSLRTQNLQQTNTAGYKWQGAAADFRKATELVRSWGPAGAKYLATQHYQAKVRELLSRYPYRLDTNFAKMDRVVHGEIEAFKSRVMAKRVHGMSIQEWKRLLASGNDAQIQAVLKNKFDIKEGNADELIQ